MVGNWQQIFQPNWNTTGTLIIQLVWPLQFICHVTCCIGKSFSPCSEPKKVHTLNFIIYLHIRRFLEAAFIRLCRRDPVYVAMHQIVPNSCLLQTIACEMAMKILHPERPSFLRLNWDIQYICPRGRCGATCTHCFATFAKPLRGHTKLKGLQL